MLSATSRRDFSMPNVKLELGIPKTEAVPSGVGDFGHHSGIDIPARPPATELRLGRLSAGSTLTATTCTQ